MRSQSVQRDMPRPTDVNSNILRVAGPGDPALTDLQKVKSIDILILNNSTNQKVTNCTAWLNPLLSMCNLEFVLLYYT